MLLKNEEGHQVERILQDELKNILLEEETNIDENKLGQ